MPQLGRTRRIWIYLPPDYYTETAKHYPVYYMHDGQNLFDAATAFNGTEWQVDESLNTLFAAGKSEGVIVVGIDHGSSFRDEEYAPWIRERNGNVEGGEGDKYVDFLIHTLKPYIDSNFRSLTDRQNTGIGGGSLGGLISLYAAIRNPEVFGSAAVISPAFWFNPEIMGYLKSRPWTQDIRIYMVTSELEGAGSVGAYQEAYKSLREAGHSYRLIRKKITPTGGHNELYYREQFPEAFLWMFEPEQLLGFEELSQAEAGLRVYPNPATDKLQITLPANWDGKAEAYLMDVLGRQRTSPVQINVTETLSIETLPAGLYYLIVTSDQKRVTLSIIKN